MIAGFGISRIGQLGEREDEQVTGGNDLRGACLDHLLELFIECLNLGVGVPELLHRCAQAELHS